MLNFGAFLVKSTTQRRRFLSVFLRSLGFGIYKTRDEVPTFLVIIVGGNFAAYVLFYILFKVKCTQSPDINEPPHTKTDQVTVRPVSRNRRLKFPGAIFRRVKYSKLRKPITSLWINTFSNGFFFWFVFFGLMLNPKI